MTIQDLLEFFRAQVTRDTGLPCILGPTTIKSAAPTVYVLPRKVKLRHDMQGDDDDPVVLVSMQIRLRASIEGSGLALKSALDASHKLAYFLSAETMLEDAGAVAMPDFIFAATAAEEDAYADTEESGQMFGVADTYLAELCFPRSYL